MTPRVEPGSEVPAAAEALFGDEVMLAIAYADRLATEGVKRGLIGPREAPRVWERHVLNSMAVSGAVPTGATVVDVGSGAGLPGIPLAIGRPDVRVTLLEPLLRRSVFLQETVESLGLGERVRVIRGRAEDHRETYDVVTARAVAPLTRLLGWCLPLVRRGGRLVAMKGESAEAELSEATKDLRAADLRGSIEVATPYAGAEPTRLLIVDT